MGTETSILHDRSGGSYTTDPSLQHECHGCTHGLLIKEGSAALLDLFEMFGELCGNSAWWRGRL